MDGIVFLLLILIPYTFYTLVLGARFVSLVYYILYCMLINPEETIKPLLLRDDSRVADLGAGSGVFTLAAVKYIYTGKVAALADAAREAGLKF